MITAFVANMLRRQLRTCRNRHPASGALSLNLCLINQQLTAIAGRNPHMQVTTHF